MKKIVFTGLALIMLLLFTAAGKQLPKGVKNAGILPYTFRNGKAYILLSRESGTIFWTDFIGKYNAEKDHDDIAKTAAREFVEESNCYFDLDKIYKQIRKKQYIHINQSTVRYFLEIPMVSPEELLSSPYACSDVEKSGYQWVEVCHFLKTIQNSTDDTCVIVKTRSGSEIRLDKDIPPSFRGNTPSRIELERLTLRN